MFAVGGVGGAYCKGGSDRLVGEHEADAGWDMLQVEPLSDTRDGGLSESYERAGEERARALSKGISSGTGGRIPRRSGSPAAPINGEKS